MTSTYVTVRKELAAQNTDSTLKCMVCGHPTAWDVLSMHGARCYPCYQQYCRADPEWPEPVKLPAIEHNSRLSWAYRLKWREERGDHMTQVQKTLWREALQ